MRQRPSAIRDELQRLIVLHGRHFRPEVVVEAASAEDSPLHDSFDWNDTEAAKNWRLQQARMLIRATVTYEAVSKDKLMPCRVFVSLTPDREKGGAGYRLTSDVLSDAEHREQMLADAKDEMNRFRAKYRMLTELAEVFAAMDRVDEAATTEDAPFPFSAEELMGQ